MFAARRDLIRRAPCFTRASLRPTGMLSVEHTNNFVPTIVPFSSQSQAVTEETTKELPVFQHPKAEALFKKIIETCSKEDVMLLPDAVNNIIHRPIREKEFLYRGIGGKKIKGSGGGGGGDVDGEGEVAAAAEKTTFDVRLESFDAKAKIKVIKEVRAIAGLGLKEAKELVENAPKVIKGDIKKEEAEELRNKLEEIGAKIEIV